MKKAIILFSIILLTAMQLQAQTRVKRNIAEAWKQFTLTAQKKSPDSLKSCFALPLHYFVLGQVAEDKTVTDIQKIAINAKFFKLAKTTLPHPSEFDKKVSYLPNGYTDTAGKSIDPAVYCKVPKDVQLYEVHLSYQDGEAHNKEIYLFYYQNNSLVLYAINNLNQ